MKYCKLYSIMIKDIKTVLFLFPEKNKFIKTESKNGESMKLETAHTVTEVEENEVENVGEEDRNPLQEEEAEVDEKTDETNQQDRPT